VNDPRIARLARVLVQYSIKLKAGQLVQINATPPAAPLVREVYRAALEAGAYPLVRIGLEDLEGLLYKYGSDEQIAYLPEVTRKEYEDIDAYVTILASENTRRLSAADPRKVALRRQALGEIQRRTMTRVAEGSLNWVGTLFPTQAAAQDAEMSLDDYQAFVFGAGKLDEDDPVAAWRAVHDRQQGVADMLGAKQVIRLVGPGTDLTYHTGGRRWLNADGTHNFPDGEVYSSPDETKTEGHIHFTFPAVYQGREVSGIRLVFSQGKVVQATADKGEDLLRSLLDMDEGARRLGEAAFGLNEQIQHFSRNILFDEKIGGTIHLALGQSFPEIGGQNRSSLHWDLVCDMRAGSQVYADGELIYRDGKFVV
jgi:aminopeptidase